MDKDAHKVMCGSSTEESECTLGIMVPIFKGMVMSESAVATQP